MCLQTLACSGFPKGAHMDLGSKRATRVRRAPQVVTYQGVSVLAHFHSQGTWYHTPKCGTPCSTVRYTLLPENPFPGGALSSWLTSEVFPWMAGFFWPSSCDPGQTGLQHSMLPEMRARRADIQSHSTLPWIRSRVSPLRTLWPTREHGLWRRAESCDIIRLSTPGRRQTGSANVASVP
jgi:hypothetical protein